MNGVLMARLLVALNAVALLAALAIAVVAGVHHATRYDPTVWQDNGNGDRYRCVAGVMVQLNTGETFTEHGTACQYLTGPAVTR